jgi:hypothetical protein
LPFTFLAGIVVVFHLGFVGCVLFGGLFFSRWSWLIWLHVPAVVYAILVQTIGWRCPLTDLEKWLRSLGGQEPYGAEFLPHYVWSPIGLTGSDLIIAVGLVAAIVLINARAYLAWAAAS